MGEAALVVIDNIGEENIPGIFLSEPKKSVSGTRYRKGFTTTAKSKLAACAKLKALVETKRMTIASKLLISELKTFVALGNSFEAKMGEHDDLVASLLLVVRVSEILSDWDIRISDSITSRDEFQEDYEPPLPIFISGL
mgnify:CR=1 FL=1